MKEILKIYLLIFFTNFAFASNNSLPNDFAYGFEINTNNALASISKFTIPKKVYTDTYSKDLDDIRIFNIKGELVPFALNDQITEKSTLKEIGLTLFKLDDNIEKINKEIEQGKIDISNYEYTYLFKLPKDSNISNTFKNLKFIWDVSEYNWEANVDIYLKDNTNSKMSEVVTKRSLMQLRDLDNKNLFKLDTIDLRNYYIYDKNRESNFVVKISSKTKVPEIKSAIGGFEEYKKDLVYLELKANFLNEENDGLVYTLESSQPTSEIIIRLGDYNAIFPAEIYYKKDKNSSEWIKLKDIILSSVGQIENTIIFNSPILVEKIKLKPVNTSYGNLPQVYINRKQQEVLFNSANNGPFILAFGSNVAKNAAINPNIFLENNYISQAYIGKEVVLGGKSMLEQKDNQEKKSKILNFVIWLFLGLGVLVLVFLAIKLTKEIKKDI